jgi:hypothetical protein
MSRPLKVYGWQGDRRECPKAPNGGHQTREFAAASSKAEVRRLAGVHAPPANEIRETGNAGEIARATAEPRVVWWRPLDDHSGRVVRAGETWT